jgi:hypothetical protein
VLLLATLRANRIARQINPSLRTTLGESLGMPGTWAMPAGKPLLALAPEANVGRPSVRRASLIKAFSHQPGKITDSENKIYLLYRFASDRICYASKKQQLCIAMLKELCYSVQ